jgi:hypothetical protein
MERECSRQHDDIQASSPHALAIVGILVVEKVFLPQLTDSTKQLWP